MTEWQQCVIVGCGCRRRIQADRDGIHDDEWICRGHWSMASKKRRTFYKRVQRRVKEIWMDRGDASDNRKLVSVYRYLWYRLKNEITQKAVGI